MNSISISDLFYFWKRSFVTSQGSNLFISVKLILFITFGLPYIDFVF